MKFLRNLVILGAVISMAGARANPIVDDYRLNATLSQAGVEQPLKSWSFDELSRLKTASSRERDPESGKLVNWKGVLLSSVVDAALGGLAAEHKARVDLVILKSETGRALIPRAFIVKYPVLLALARDNKWDLGEQGPIYSVIPWTSKGDRIRREDVPVESFFLPRVRTIEFANYRDQYGFLFLKRRTDPAAMRGEKLFIQNCVSCHVGSGRGPAPAALGSGERARQVAMASDEHPRVRGFVRRFTEQDVRSLVSYLDAYRVENPLKTASN
jgi:hypothetical protein